MPCKTIFSWAVATVLAIIALALQLVSAAEVRRTTANIVIILADDLGFGDTSCYGATRIPTPNVDRLAREGLRFRDAHSTSATCTPARYALLTGEYPWRKKGTGILPGDAELIIKPGRTTVASLLQRAGYQTGVVGKWHLGLGGKGGPDWNGEVKPGVSDALVCHVDFLASFAALTGQKLAAGDGPDSRNVLAALLGQSQSGRDQLVEHASVLALRDGLWKYIEPGTGPRRNAATNTELGIDPAGQLYQLADDLGETNNLLQAQPDRSRKLLDELKAARQLPEARAVGQD